MCTSCTLLSKQWLLMWRCWRQCRFLSHICIVRQFGSNRNTSIGTQARGVARTRNCYMLAIQQLAGINRIEDAAECAPIACLSSPAVHMRRLPLPKDAASKRVTFHAYVCILAVI